MKKMKRVLVALLSCLTAFACLAGTVACGKDNKESASTPDTNVSESASAEVEDSSVEEVEDSSSEEEVESSEDVVDSSSEEEDSSSEEVIEPTEYDCDKNGHFLVPVEEIEPTCTSNGRAATVGCAYCDWIHDPTPVLLDRAEYATDADYFDAVDAWAYYWSQYSAYGAHDWSEEATEKVAPTCCEEGVKAYYTCANCDALSLDGYWEMEEDETIVLPATGNHNYVSYVVPVAATCTEDGCTVGWECEKGGYVASEVIPAFGHSYVFDAEAEDYVAGTIVPTCKTDAECGRCKVTLEDTKLGHSLVSVDAQVVTCAADGWDAFEYCENCEYTTFAGKIKATDHWNEQKKADNYTKVDAVAAKCDVEGNKAYYVCNDCSAVRSTLTGSVLTEEQIKASIVIKALEHSFTKADKVVAKAATCLNEGNTAGGTCSKCDVYVASEVIPALGHTYEFDTEAEDFVAGTIVPTCKTDAKCGRCKVTLEDTKLGHTWEYVGVVYAECEKAGVAAHYECATCKLWAVENNEEAENTADKLVDGYTETAASKFVIKALGHDIVNVAAKAPTCYAIGWNAYKYCAHCSYTTYKELAITADHKSANMVSCSEWLVCETFATKDNNGDEVIDENDIYDVNEDGEVNELDNIHVGCGKVYANPAPVAHTWNEDNVCSVCSVCNHKDADNDGVCDNCDKCFHKYYVNGECAYCGEACDHASFTGIYCNNCDYVCKCEVHNVEGKCVLCGSNVEHEIDPETGKCVCGLMCEHNFVTEGEDKVCEKCRYVCLHVDYTNGVCVCGQPCAHEAHDVEGVCNVCSMNVGHSWAAVEGSTDWACDCGLTCSHEMHVQQSGSVTDSTCTTCGANVKHVYDLSAITVAMPTVKCTICKGVVAVVDVCPHTGAHEQDNSCGVCGKANVAVHGDADFDGFCDICDKQGVGALITESTVLNQNITATDVNNVAQNSQWAARVDGEEVEVTITGGTYNAGSNKTYNIAVWAANGATVTIEDGLFVTGKDASGDSNHVVYASGGATVCINGGTFKASDDMDSSMLINCQDGNATIVITGGTFYNFNPANNVADGANTNYVAEGYTVKVTTVGSDTIYTVEAANN